MLFDYIILIATAGAGGIAAFFLPKTNTKLYRLSLVFSGAYLFGITIIHILPELFASKELSGHVGIFVLFGFFLQMVLENMTAGVEHGHLHHHTHEPHLSKALIILVGLSIHAFLEGTLLSHPLTLDEHEGHSHTLLWGIALHKGPAAFALMSILLGSNTSRNRSLLFLLLFALASPIGLWAGNYLQEYQLLSASGFIILFAVVSGNFLHISTTIVFESSENHRLNWQKWLIGLLGAGLAILAEFI
jgi:zinc transporter ZupT